MRNDKEGKGCSDEMTSEGAIDKLIIRACLGPVTLKDRRHDKHRPIGWQRERTCLGTH